MLKRITCFLLVVLLLFSLILSGCTTSPDTNISTPAPSTSGVLTLTGSDPYTLDPAASDDALSASYIMQMFSGLLKLDDNLEPVPDIAASMPIISQDGLTYTFTLRQDVKFHDGRSVTASDFKYSWERAASPATNSPTASAYLGDIVGVKDMLSGKADQIRGVSVVDTYTLQVTVDAPKSYFLYKLTFPASFVVDQNNVNLGANWWQKPNGTGQFKMHEWVEGTDFILDRNDLYYGDKAKIAQVKMMFNSTYSDEDLFETGQIDIGFASAVYYDELYDEVGPFYNDLYVFPELSVNYIGFNCEQPPFDDASIRQAFSLAIDKDKIISLVYRDMLQNADGILPSGIPGYNINLLGLGFDVNKSQELIKSSKYGDVSKLPDITLVIAGAGGSADPITQALVYQWKQNLGVDVTVRQLEPQTYSASPLQNQDQMYDFGWIADYPHPQDFLDILFSSGSVFNYGGYSNLTVDKLIQQANQTLDQTQAFSLYQQAEQQIVNDAACLPLVFGETYLLVKPYVKNASINALGIINFNEITISAD